jgi:hypothetical protein
MVGWRWNKWTETIYCKDQDDAEPCTPARVGHGALRLVAIRSLDVLSLAKEPFTSPVLRQVLVSSIQ